MYIHNTYIQALYAKQTLFSVQHEVDKFLSISTCTATGHLLYWSTHTVDYTVYVYDMVTQRKWKWLGKVTLSLNLITHSTHSIRELTLN